MRVFRRSDRPSCKIYYTWLDGTRHSLETEDHDEAVRRACCLLGRPVPHSSHTLSWLADRALVEQLRASRARGHLADVRKICEKLREHLGAVRVQDVTTWQLRDIIPHCVGPSAGPARRNRMRACLHRIFNLAVEEGLLERNPVTWRPEKEKGKPRPAFTREDLEFLLAAAKQGIGSWQPPTYLYGLVLLAATTGARKGEILALLGQDVDRSTATLTLHSTKTGAHRQLKLLPAVLANLPVVAPENRIFPVDCRRTFDTLLEKTGLDKKGLCFHSLRHTFTTYTARTGVPLAILRDILGHGSLSTTERYAKRIGAPIEVGGALLSQLSLPEKVYDEDPKTSSNPA